MLKRSISILSTFLILIFLVSCQEDLPTNPDIDNSNELNLKKGNFSSNVSGSGHIINNLDQMRKFTFNARKNTDGSVSGHFTLNNKEVTGYLLKGTIICLKVDGNMAYLGGRIDKSNIQTNPAWDDGSYLVFSLVDNGEGKNSPSDQLSLVNAVASESAVEAWCDNPTLLPLTEINNGNIQIH